MASKWWIMLDPESGAASIVGRATHGAERVVEDTICGVVILGGPNGEPLACGYAPDHEGAHSWATLPSFASTGGESPARKGQS